MLQKIKTFLLDFLLPRRCIGCDRPDTWWCEECFRMVSETPTVSMDEAPLDRLIVAAAYDHPLIKRAISALKYQGRTEDIAPKLGLLLTRVLNEQAPSPCQTLVPIPLHSSRQQERGFNQAELLCQAMVKHSSGVLRLNSALLKTKETLPQVGLSRSRRMENIRGAFCLGSEIEKDSHYILVDDVVTTGATLKECARVLKKHGAKEVWGLVVARN